MKYALLFVIITALVGCKKDSPQELILGRWQYMGLETNGEVDPPVSAWYYKFNSDNQMEYQNSSGVTTKTMQYAFQDEWLYIDAHSSSAQNWLYDITENIMWLHSNPSETTKLRFERR